MNTLTVITVLMSIAGVLCQDSVSFYGCAWVNSQFVNCDRFAAQSYCGTNLVTYNNLCEFSRAHCADGTIDLKHNGACTDIDLGISTASPVDGAEAVFDFFCTALSKEDCPADVNKVCASDGNTYANFCEYEKERCTHRNLDVLYYGQCTI